MPFKKQSTPQTPIQNANNSQFAERKIYSKITVFSCREPVGCLENKKLIEEQSQVFACAFHGEFLYVFLLS